MIDRDLAALYGVPTFALNQAVRRNADRFPPRFMFRLSASEAAAVIRSSAHLTALKHSTVTPIAFTSYGIAMLSSVLRSRRAVAINIQIIETFIRMGELMETRHAIAERIAEIERTVKIHDRRIRAVFEAIRNLIGPKEENRRRIGFRP